MNDLDKDKLLYRPKLRPEREYLSDGEITYFPLVPPEPLEEPLDDSPTQIVDDLKEIEEIYHLLPEDVQHMKESIKKIKQRVIIAFPPGVYVPSTYEPPTDPTSPETTPPEESGNPPTPYQPGTYTEGPHVHGGTYEPGSHTPGTYTPGTNKGGGPKPHTYTPGSTTKGTQGPTRHYPWEPREREYGPSEEPIVEKPGIIERHVQSHVPNIEDGWQSGYTPGTLPDIINFYDTAINDNPDLDQLPQLFPQMSNIVLKVEQPKTLVQLIQDSYAKDQIELDKYYVQKLQTIMQKYFQQMMAIMADCGVSSIDDLTKDFDGDYVQVPADKGLEHLRDYIVRSQVQRNQISRMFHKTHSTDKTLMHMRSWHAANEQRKRYYSEEYKDSTNFTESHSNSLLRESRATYDNAYEASLYDMYKYLNSSVMITNDILDLTTKEAQAKAELLKNNVDIYAFDQSEAEFAKLATDAGQLGDGKGSGFDKDASENKDDKKDADKKDDESTDSDKTEQASDEQYENDIKYLMDQGYDKAAADAELAKLPQYKDRLGKKEEAKAEDSKKEETKKEEAKKAQEDKKSTTANSIVSGSTSTAGLWSELASSALKNPIGKLTGAIAGNNILGKIIDTKSVDKTINDVAQKAIGNISKDLEKGVTNALSKVIVQQNSSKKVESQKKDVQEKDAQKKYPEYNRIDYENDDKLTQCKKRVAQIKQDIAELDAQLADIKKERKETGHSTLRHNELVKASRNRSKLMKELAELSS